ncbi:inactive serine protease PAMR1 [Electrophorus electricus]|uniref:inactive serine protease PAMR1 n=1 Tax=Electrophorus electricus TaxID=8005 RepID=UPI0015D069B2|nr:inactive serine protease PAMR1 [Electrophorus electricus]
MVYSVGNSRSWMLHQVCLLLLLLLSVLRYCCLETAWPHGSGAQEDNCPGPRWNAMCRSCCEYEQIHCTCPSQRTRVGYAVPCCRNAMHHCDPCIIHQGCSVFDNCKRCNNGTWKAKDDFYISSSYCMECRQGWSGGDCLTCGEVIRRSQGHVTLESYPINAKCEWTLQVSRGLTMELRQLPFLLTFFFRQTNLYKNSPHFCCSFFYRFTMLSLEFDHSCDYDYIEVRDGDSLNSRVIGRYCGNDIPSPIRSSGHSLHIRFVSDGYNNYDGFSATFQEHSACGCMNAGMCSLDPLKTFHCVCPEGFTGLRCENKQVPPGCADPGKPAHGDHFLQYEDGDIATSVQYLCYKPYKLRGTPWRTCLSNSTWSGTAPTCVRETQPIRKVCLPPPQLRHGYSTKNTGPDGVIKSIKFFCNNPYVLSGSSERTCQENGTWTGSQPQCIRACREPKISKLVRQTVLKHQPPSRKSPLHRVYSFYQPSSAEGVRTGSVATALAELPPGFHHQYTIIEYECASPLYQSSGSTRRTCLRTGRWSGHHLSCSPVCGKLSVNSLSLTQTRWPWHTAIYHHLPDYHSHVMVGGRRHGDTFSAAEYKRLMEGSTEEQTWQLVCSGALVSQHTALVPAHCVTEPGQRATVQTSDLRVVLGKHHISDLRDSKRLQHMQVSEILVHPSYDPNMFNSDIAILKLLHKARITEFVFPVCLPHVQGGEVTTKQAYITGWPAADLHDPSPDTDSEVAHTGVIELGNVAQCERQYAQQGVPISITDNMLCGRQHPISSTIVCPAKTGGIVLLPSDSQMRSMSLPEHRRVEEAVSEPSWELLGLVSFGYNLQSCNPGLFTVYTRVANFKNWIERNSK